MCSQVLTKDDGSNGYQIIESYVYDKGKLGISSSQKSFDFLYMAI